MPELCCFVASKKPSVLKMSYGRRPANSEGLVSFAAKCVVVIEHKVFVKPAACRDISRGCVTDCFELKSPFDRS